MRDPRKDPKPGDKIQKGKLSRMVNRREGWDIWYVNASGDEKLCWISTWRSWARGAEVIHAAE